MRSFSLGVLLLHGIHALELEGLSFVQARARFIRGSALLKKSVGDDQCPNTTDGGALHGMSMNDFRKLESRTTRLREQEHQQQTEVQQNQARLLLPPNNSDACASMWNERTILQAIINPYHGSTSLLELLMSSSKLATLCTAMTWQCEGSWLLKNTTFSNVPKLDVFSKFWDLRQPVLFDKATDLFWGGGRDWPENLHTLAVAPFDDKRITMEMRDLGIVRLRKAFVLMWRPYCLRNTSSHIIGMGKHGQLSEDILGNKTKPQEFTEEVESYEEYLRYQQLLDGYSKLLELGVTAIILSYGDLLFKSDKVVHQLQAFIPCLGPLSAQYVPRSEQDVYACNQWKAAGSIADYASEVNPESLKYDAELGQCLPDYDVFASIKDPKYAELARQSVTKLRELSGN